MDLLHRRTSRLIALSSVLIALTACVDATEATTTTTKDLTSTTVTSTTLPSTTTTPEPEVQEKIDWFVSVLNGVELSEAEYEERFTDEFRAQVPFAEGFLPVLEQFRPMGPFTVVDRSGEGTRGVAVIESSEAHRRGSWPTSTTRVASRG